MAKIFIKLPQLLKRKIKNETLEAQNLKELLDKIKIELNLSLDNCLLTLNQKKINPQENLERKLKDNDILEIIMLLAGG